MFSASKTINIQRLTSYAAKPVGTFSRYKSCRSSVWNERNTSVPSSRTFTSSTTVRNSARMAPPETKGFQVCVVFVALQRRYWYLGCDSLIILCLGSRILKCLSNSIPKWVTRTIVNESNLSGVKIFGMELIDSMSYCLWASFMDNWSIVIQHTKVVILHCTFLHSITATANWPPKRNQRLALHAKVSFLFTYPLFEYKLTRSTM